MMKKEAIIIFSISILCRLAYAQSIIILPKYDEIGYYSEGLASVKIGNQWGFIDMTGKTIISPTYMEVHEFHEGVAAVKTQKGWGYINKNNQFVIPPKFFNADDFSEGLAGVQDREKKEDYYGGKEYPCWNYIDMNGASPFPFHLYKTSPYHEGIACVQLEKDEQWSFIDKKGNSIAKHLYKSFEPYVFSDGLYPVSGGEFGECGYKKLTGEWGVLPEYRSVTSFNDGFALVEEYGGIYHFINVKGEKVFTCETKPLILGDGLFIQNGVIYNLNQQGEKYCIALDDEIELKTTEHLNHFLPEENSYGGGSASVASGFILREGKETMVLSNHSYSLVPYIYKYINMGIWAMKFIEKESKINHWGIVAFNYQDYISQYVSSQMDIWLKKGEFESTSAYENRTSISNRQQKEVTLADELINNWLKKGLDQWSLSNYDADNETFTLTTDLGTYKIKIPVGSAKRLKDNWASVNKQVGFKYDNGLSLAKIDFTFSQGSKDMTLSVNTATGTIQEVEHDIINKDLPSIKWLEFMATTTNKECPIKLGVNSKSKIESVSISVNGTQDRGIKTVNGSDYDLTINRTLTLNEGANVIKVSVRNAAGTTQEEKTIVYRPQGGELPTIEWLDFAVTANKKEYQMKLGIKSKTKVEEVNVTVNGALNRGLKPVPTDGYDLKVDRTLTLSEGINRIVVSVRNGDGIATSEKVITYQGINPTPIFNDKRIALIMGNANYNDSDKKLNNPVNDATDLANKLEGLGFTVIRSLDQTKKGMETAINEFGQKAGQYDVALFYYAGHGIRCNGDNFLVPVDADLPDESFVEYNCTNANLVLSIMDKARCPMKIVILDACRNNPFARSWHRSTNNGGLNMMHAPKGTFIAFSTGPGDVANDGVGQRNSPYTSALLQTLDIPNLSIMDFFQRVGAEVMQMTKQSQTPWTSSSFTGDFYFNKQ